MCGVLQAGDGTVWVGSAVGLDRWRDSTISRVSLSPSEGSRVVEQSVLALADAGDGGVWAGTYSQGVVRLDAQGRVLVRIGAADGLPSMSVRAVLPDGDDPWIGTTAGLVPGATARRAATPLPTVYRTARCRGCTAMRRASCGSAPIAA